MLQEGTEAPVLAGITINEKFEELPFLDQWVYVLFNPVFRKFGCKDCQKSLLHERYPDLRAEKCLVFGATYDPPYVNDRRNNPHVWKIPIIQVSHEMAATWDSLRHEKDAWYQYTPRSCGYLIDPSRIIRRTYEFPDPVTHADQLLSDLRELKQATAHQLAGGSGAISSR